MLTALVFATTALAYATASPDASLESPAPGVVEPGEREPTSDDRAAAATTSGVGAFVGTALGGVIVPGVAGLIGNAVGGRLNSENLLIVSTIGGTAGAAVGGAFGAVFTTKAFIGPALVGVAGAAGAAAGLVPGIFVAKIKPATTDPNDPVKLGESACLLASLLASSAAAAGTGALMAAPAPPPDVRK